ncbi:C45 family peptidase [Thalassoroseus pseudoceratinae]|uniref:peptidase C45 n=1 Tax=Thalassoroseus pseudoceratinae TaxID=2713176 RepID=UPI001421ACED|nr:peptidase C45 [Thalassoroseus pseudoceratinae]
MAKLNRGSVHAILGMLGLVCAFFSVQTRCMGCTIAVVSGRVTPDQRPLLWKNRDTSTRENDVRYFDDGELQCVAVVDQHDSDRIWMGMNEAGFCIENSLSKDLPRGSSRGYGNGRFMKQALQTCRTAADFETLLDRTNQSGRRTRANFAVIDAEGAAVLYEAGHRSFAKFDANDPQTAPEGFIVRSNFSMTASKPKALKLGGFEKVYSGNRYLRAERLLRQELEQTGTIDYRFFLETCSRDLSDGINVVTPNRKLMPVVDTRSTINRFNTVSAAVFQGVRDGESSDLTTMWTMLGEPVFSVAVPFWVNTARSKRLAERKIKMDHLCAAVYEIRQANYASDNEQILQTRHLNQIWSRTIRAEKEIVDRTTVQLSQWRKTTPPAHTLLKFQEAMAAIALQALLDVPVGDATVEPAIAEN